MTTPQIMATVKLSITSPPMNRSASDLARAADHDCIRLVPVISALPAAARLELCRRLRRSI